MKDSGLKAEGDRGFPLGSVPSYVTKDGSHIRELVHPLVHGNKNQSLAEATVPPGVKTHRHRHRVSEEIYHILRGLGRMDLGEASFEVGPRDTVLIPEGIPHAIENIGEDPLVFLCVCSPPYAHEDTLLG